MLQRMLGPRVATIASGRPVARQVEHVLGVRGLAHPRGDRPGPPAQGEYRFLCTGDVERFRALGTRFLQMPLGEIARVDVDGARVAAVAAGRRGHERRGAPAQRRARARRAASDRRSSPASCARPPARR